MSGCGDPLIEVTIHKTEEEAKEASWDAKQKGREWEPHPQGGIYVQSGQGESWVISLLDFVLIKNPKEETDVHDESVLP